MSIEERVNQEISPPFCILPAPSRRGRESPRPLFVLLAAGGVGFLGFGIWWLSVAWPDYSLPIVVILASGVLLWFAAKVFRSIDAGDGWWLGYERFYMRSAAPLASWPWMDVGSFREIESVKSDFEIKYKGTALDDEVNYRHEATLDLSAEVREGPRISIPFEAFVADDSRVRDGAENFCRFLKDVRQRAKTGGLAHGAPPFLAPIEFAIAPMKDGAPVFPRSQITGNAKPVVQRRP